MASLNADITESELVKACLEGNALAQQALYQKYAPVMYAICLRYCGSPDNAKDMLQESFIKLFESLKNFRFQGSFEGWTKRIAVTTCLDFIKKLKQEPYAEELENHTHLGVEATVFPALGMKDLLALLQTLPVGYRTVFNLYAIEGYNHGQIAELMGISENTSKTQLFKARRLLQLKLTEKG
ncbi:MAG: RNA polymerase sigma factor [Bacteroidetes bacterium]|jgi:RNA polymerase sigma factor (sigma-70 family)|nr:RNA polymerase sigma factor [Bacteroidota bacterium]